MTNSFKISHKVVKDVTNLTLSGQLTINHIEKIAGDTKEILKGASDVTILVKDVENLDLTFVQFLYAIKNSGKKNNFKLKVTMNLSEDLNSLVTNAGFENIINQN